MSVLAGNDPVVGALRFGKLGDCDGAAVRSEDAGVEAREVEIGVGSELYYRVGGKELGGFFNAERPSSQ